MSEQLSQAIREVKRHACPLCHAPAGKRCSNVIALPGTFSIRLRLRHPHAERTALVFPVWRKDDKDPGAGHPHEREWRVHGNAANDRRYAVSELTCDRGLVPVISGLDRWQALAIVAILVHPHGN